MERFNFNSEDKMNPIVLFVLKSLLFSIVFWITWGFVMRPILNAQPTAESNKSKSQDSAADSDALMKKHWEQVESADLVQRRVEIMLNKEEEQIRRFDVILSNWERQSKLGK